jgi:K+ transporter
VTDPPGRAVLRAGHGIPLVIAAGVATVILTWQRGRELVNAATPSEYFRLPEDHTVVMGAQLTF